MKSDDNNARDITDHFGADPSETFWMCFWLLVFFIFVFGVAQMLGRNTNDSLKDDEINPKSSFYQAVPALTLSYLKEG